MCTTCGCKDNNQETKIYKVAHNDDVNLKNSKPHIEEQHHQPHHHHHHYRTDYIQIDIEKNILTENDKLAERNRGYFEAKEIFAINMVSSPGSGKTTILEKTLYNIGKIKQCYVIEGDQQTDNDARRIASTGIEVIQINTGNACHLDAHMIYRAVYDLNPTNGSILFIENVGNLVCPALFDLGENLRVVIFSVTEGEDKPLKYPNMFHSAQLVIINKVDLLPYLKFDIGIAKENVHKINAKATIIELSATTGEGFETWTNLLLEK